MGHTRTDGTLCGYRSGLLVDAKRWIIVAVIFVALNCVEAPLVIQALDKQYAIFRSYPQRLGLDSAFDAMRCIPIWRRTTSPVASPYAVVQVLLAFFTPMPLSGTPPDNCCARRRRSCSR